MKNKIVNYLKETRVEVKKVAWPSREYITQATMIILLVSFLIGLFVMVLDLFFARAILILNSVF